MFHQQKVKTYIKNDVHPIQTILESNYVFHQNQKMIFKGGGGQNNLTKIITDPK